MNGGAGEVRLQIGGRARGGAHEEHVVHGCDAGRVEAQRLVERRRVLPRVERRAYTVRGKVRATGVQQEGGALAIAVQAARRGALDCMQIGAEHTWNM